MISSLSKLNWRRTMKCLLDRKCGSTRLLLGRPDDSISPLYSWSESVCRIACRNYGMNPLESKLEAQSPEFRSLKNEEYFIRKISNISLEAIKALSDKLDFQFQEVQADNDEIISLNSQVKELIPLVFEFKSKLPEFISKVCEFRSKVVPDFKMEKPDLKSQDPDDIRSELNEPGCIADNFKFEVDDVLAEVDELISLKSQADELIPLVYEFRSKVPEFRSKIREFRSKIVVPNLESQDLDGDRCELNQLKWMADAFKFEFADLLAQADDLISDVYDDLISVVYDDLRLDGFSLTRSCLVMKALIWFARRAAQKEEQSSKFRSFKSEEDFKHNICSIPMEALKSVCAKLDLPLEEVPADVDEIISLESQVKELIPLVFEVKSKLPEFRFKVREFRSKVVPDLKIEKAHLKSQDSDNIRSKLNELGCVVDNFEVDDFLAELDELISLNSQANELISLVSEFRSKVREFRSKFHEFRSKVVVLPDLKSQDPDDDRSKLNRLRLIVNASKFEVIDRLDQVDDLISDVYDDLISEVYDDLRLDGFGLTTSSLLMKALISHKGLFNKGSCEESSHLAGGPVFESLQASEVTRKLRHMQLKIGEVSIFSIKDGI